MATQPVATDEYQPLVWQVVVDGLGYSSVHETDEDGKPGDLVAHTYGDHIQLIAAAPDLLDALTDAVSIIDDQLCGDFPDSLAHFRAVLAKARGQ